MNINDLRINYSKSSIDFDDLISDPKELFKVWFNDWKKQGGIILSCM